MPFKNREQQKACYAKNDPNWDCDKWSKETKGKLRGKKMQEGGIHNSKLDKFFEQMSNVNRDPELVNYANSHIENRSEVGPVDKGRSKLKKLSKQDILESNQMRSDSVVNRTKMMNSTKADIFRSLIPLPKNITQLLAKTVLGDSRMTNSSLDDDEKLILWNTIQNAKSRTGKPDGGTEYEDYAGEYGTKEDFNNAWNKGKASGVLQSFINPAMNLASTIGRGRYWTDPKTNNVTYTDVYDWNSNKEKNFGKNGEDLNMYQKLRNNLRDGEDKNLNVAKNDANRMNFILDKSEIDRIKRSKEEMPMEAYAAFKRGGKMQFGGKAGDKIHFDNVGYGQDIGNPHISRFLPTMQMQPDEVPYQDIMQNAPSDESYILPNKSTTMGLQVGKQPYDWETRKANFPAKDSNKIDPYFLLKGTTTGLSWLSGMAERNRQDQYMREQLSQLGQRDAMPVSNFQPNPYRLYSKLGGNIHKFQEGGRLVDKIPDGYNPLRSETLPDGTIRDYFNIQARTSGTTLRPTTHSVTRPRVPAAAARTPIARRPIQSVGNFQDTIYTERRPIPVPTQPVMADEPAYARAGEYVMLGDHMAGQIFYPSRNSVGVRDGGTQNTANNTSLIKFRGDNGFTGEETIITPEDHQTYFGTGHNFLNKDLYDHLKAKAATAKKVEGGQFKKGGWIQDATKGMRTDKPCTGSKFGGPSCRPGTKRYALAKTFKKMAKS